MSTSKTWPGGATGASPTSYSIPAAGELNWAALSDFLIALADGAQSTTFQKFAVRKATTSPVTVSATTDCVVVSDLSVAGAVAVNLPAGQNKQVFMIVDGKGDAATNNITITPNGAETIAGSANLVLNGSREGVILIYNSGDTDWKIVGRMTGMAAFVNPMDSAGDMIYGGASGTPTKLDAGTANYLLTAQGASAPSWALLVNANVDAAAAIAFSKLAALTSGNILVGNGSNVATSVAMTGDIGISNAGVTAIQSGVIVNADVNASAAIDGSKISPAFTTNTTITDAGGANPTLNVKNNAGGGGATGRIIIESSGTSASANLRFIPTGTGKATLQSALTTGYSFESGAGSEVFFIANTGGFTANGASTISDAAGASPTLTVKNNAGGGGSTARLYIESTGTGASASLRFIPTGSGKATIQNALTTGYSFESGAGSEIGFLSNGGALTLSSGVVGRTSGAAASGNLGEVSTASRARGSATGLTTNTAKSVVSITLGAGVWRLVYQSGVNIAGGTTMTRWQWAISLTDNTLPGSDTYAVATSGEIRGESNVTQATNSDNTTCSVESTVAITGSTTYYGISFATHNGTVTAYGQITAIRIG